MLHNTAAAASSASAAVVAAERGGGPPVGTEVIETGRWRGKIACLGGTCGSWAGPPNPEEIKRGNKSTHRLSAYAFTS